MLAPLDWGWGHTTRCLPLIRRLQELGASICFAGNDAQQTFVRRQFPQLHFLPLEGYEVQYPRKGIGFLPKMLAQVPRIALRIRSEHHWLRQAVAQWGIKGVISDNRYGLWHPQVPSVVVCHQLALHTGLGAWVDARATAVNQRLLAKFGSIWVPDNSTPPGLSGRLGHPLHLPANTKYIGPLSQFQNVLPAASGTREKQKKLLILLSGPEPQRSILSDLLWPQVQALNLPTVFVEGKAQAPPRASSEAVTWHALRSGRELQTVLEAASYVVCRGGYTTLMEAAELDLKLLVIPTPGQGEQQYLGKQLEETGRGLCFKQSGFSLKQALERAASFPFALVVPAGDQESRFETVLEDWYRRL